MDNNYDILGPFCKEFEQIGFHEGFREGFSKGSSRGFKRGVIATISAYVVYKVVKWYKEETKELDD